MLNIACVQVGNYGGRGAEYVNVLFDMVYRNLGIPYRFVCFTDDPEGLNEAIDARPAVGEGWWAKLALFAPEAFEAGDRVLYFDLDTLVIGEITELAEYQGKFACLRDFYRPDGYGSGVMAWEAGTLSHVWFDWVAAGKPQVSGGDQAWLEKVLEADRLQDLYPGKLVSYKADCHPYPPKGAAVVCFHGEPKPHNCLQGWVQETWKVGGNQALNLQVLPNTSESVAVKQAVENKDRAPVILKCPEHQGRALLVGSAPSMRDYLPVIAGMKQAGDTLFAMNNAAKVLRENGIEVDYQVLIDPRDHNTTFVQEQYANAYLFASQVHPSLFDTVKGRRVYQFHMAVEGMEEAFPDGRLTLVGGGTSVGITAMALAYTMGYRKMSLFGYDSSYRDDQSHAEPQRRTEQEKWTFDVYACGRKFRTNSAMAKQAEVFPIVATELANLDCEIRVYGDGLLPAIAHAMID